jgi:hypothetical protein
MHSVELLELALDAARQLGYVVREDALGGFPGGACQIKGKKWLFLDPSRATRERLELVLEAIAADPLATVTQLPPQLMRLLKIRHSV